ncbi:MAG: T9SS type A sorting domain-containing protein [Bacteroidota bacterium]
MKNSLRLLLIGSFIAVISFRFFALRGPEREGKEELNERKGLISFDWWYDQRALPGNIIQPDGLAKAFQYTQQTMMSLKKGPAEEPWQSIGPDNVGGRVLSLAFDPDSSNVLWAGSASGGIWISRTGGAGADAWDYVNTGFNVLAVGTIAVNQSNSKEIYVGTGEISGYELGLVGTPGARTTYGLGIVKSTDKGKTWISTGLTWLFSQNRSVQKIVINPKNPRTIFAATSEGTYRSLNSGGTFTRVDSTLMAMDVAINPTDTTILYIACGQRNTAPNPGLYRSTDGGSSFSKLTTGLPVSNFGRTSIAIAPSSPATVYISVASASTHSLLGLYRSTNNGTAWELMNSSTDYLNGQGWYNNVALVHPSNPAVVYTAGLDAYKSVNNGSTLTQKSYWYKSNEGVIVPGGVEGTDNTYAHADHHAIIIDPKNTNRMFFGNDGGIFESTDGGETFIGRNGGFITTQFYNGFANADTDSLIALGGLQDNGTVKYQGGMSWNKVYGGDGGWCAIHPTNPSIVFEEYVNLTIAKSTDGGVNWSSSFTPASSDTANFIAPFVISPSNGNILYAGAEKIHKSTNAGGVWAATNGGNALNSASASCLAVSFTNSDTVIAGTGRRQNPLFELFYTTNGGTTWSKSASAIPNRFPTDLTFDPNDSRIAYATFSGYGSSHVFRSSDAGKTWSDISSNLPDLPVQSVCVDPLNSSDVYLGTDLGVYRSVNSGATWETWFDGMPFAMVLDVSVSKKDHRLRAATFGNGVYQRKLRPKQTLGVQLADRSVPTEYQLAQNYPNPFNPSTTIEYSIAEHLPGLKNLEGVPVTIKMYDISGKEIATLVNEHKNAGLYSVRWDASRYSSGTYFVRMTAGEFSAVRKLTLIK